MKTLPLLCTVLFFASCKTMMLNKMVDDPTVENTSTIKAFLTAGNFSQENSLILKGDSASALGNMLQGMTNGYFVFDSVGNHLSYNGASTCKGVQFQELIKGNDKNFIRGKEEFSLLDILGNSYTLSEKDITMKDLAPAKYYVVSYWAKYMGGTKNYKSDVQFMEDQIKNSTPAGMFTFVKVNTDLQESWGMKPGGKGKLEFKKKKKNYEMEVELPVN